MRRFFSSILYLFLGLPLALSALLLLAARPWALDREFYKRFVTDDRLYSALHSSELARDAELRMELDGRIFNGPSFIAAAQNHLPESELKALGSTAVDQALDLIEGRTGGNFELDLRPLKAAFVREIPALAEDYVGALPTRTALPAPMDYTYRPDSIAPAAMAKATAASLTAAAGEIPDQVKETKLQATPKIMGVRVSDQLSLNRATFVNACVAALLIGGLALMGGGGAAAVAARAGSMLGFPSIIVLLLGVVLALPGAAIVDRLLPPEARDFLGSGARAQLRSYLSSVFGRVSRGFFLSGLVGVSVAGFLSSLKRIFEPREL